VDTSLAFADTLPEFVQRQAQAALDQFLLNSASAGQFRGRFQKTALLIQELRPHPLSGETVHLPMALLRWKNDAWQLFFRGSRGRWQPFPGIQPSIRPAPLLHHIHRDELGIFWRQ
jgi:hypothetical protein